MKSFRYLVVFILFLAQTSCVMTNLAGKSDWGFSTDYYGRRVSWKGRVPVLMYYDPSVPPEFYPAFENAAKTWGESVGHPLIIFLGVLPGTEPGYNGKNVVYYYSKDWPGDSNHLADTHYHWEESGILDADILINGRYSFSQTPNQNQFDLESAILHELGHVLGRQHETQEFSVMNPVLLQGETRRMLTDLDVADMREEY